MRSNKRVIENMKMLNSMCAVLRAGGDYWLRFIYLLRFGLLIAGSMPITDPDNACLEVLRVDRARIITQVVKCSAVNTPSLFTGGT